MHLLHLADRVGNARLNSLCFQDCRPNLAQAHARSKVKLGSSGIQNATLPLQMALIAYSILQVR